VPLVARSGQETRKTSEMFIGKVNGALHRIVRKVSDSKARAFQGKSDRQHFKVRAGDNGALHILPVNEIIGNLLAFSPIILRGIKNGRGVVVARIDLNIDDLLKILQRVISFGEDIHRCTVRERVLKRTIRVRLPEVRPLQSDTHAGCRIGEARERTHADRLRKNRSNVAVQPLKRQTEHDRGGLHYLVGVLIAFQRVGHSNGAV